MAAPINPSRGRNHHTSKLTEEDAEMIRQLKEWKVSEIARINSIASNKALSQKFDVSVRTIEKVASYETWR
jgi:hypothetical protein